MVVIQSGYLTKLTRIALVLKIEGIADSQPVAGYRNTFQTLKNPLARV